MTLTGEFEGWNLHSAQVKPARSAGSTLGNTAGFTLVEILLVLALMAMVGAVLLPAAGALFRQGSQEGPTDLVTSVLQEVRREAVLSGRPVTLRFDAEQQRFRWDGVTGGSRATPEGTRLQVDFLRRDATSAVLIAGRAVETGAIGSLTFFPDGTCDPVRVQLRRADGSAEVLTVDPWTCAPGLEVAS